MRRRWLSLLPLIALLVAVPQAFAAGPAWLDAQQISDVPHDGVQPAVAMGPDGTVIVAYEKRPHITGPAPDRGMANQLIVRQRPPGGTFGPEQVVDGSGLPLFPQVAIDSTGRAVLAWVNGDTVNTAVAPPGGDFGDELSFTGEGNSDNLNLGLDPNGEANLLWRHVGGDLRFGTRPVSGPLSPAQSLDSTHPPSSGTDHIQEVAFAEGPAGDVYAIWKHEIFDPSGPTSTVTFDAARKTAGGSYGTPIPLQSVDGSGDDVNDPAVGVDSHGNALLAWTRGFGTHTIEARFWPLGGGPGAVEHPSSVAGVGASPRIPSVAFDTLGTAVVGFTSGSGGSFASQYTARAPGGSYAPAGTLGSGSIIGNLRLAAGPLGQIVAEWVQDDATRVAVKPVGGAFSPSHQVSTSTSDLNDYANPAIDPQNNAVAGWTQLDSGIPHIYVAGYDGAGPVPNAESVPAHAVTQVPISVSFAPLDVWSGIASASWNFGDGSAAVPGLTASHAYTKPGSYAVQPDAVDGLGLHGGVVQHVNVVRFLGSFGITNRTFAVGKARTPVSAVKRGTAFKFTLGTPATVRIKITLKRRGVRVGKSCRAPSRKLTKGKHRKRCTFFQTKGTLTRHGLHGSARVPFSGRIGRKALKPGRYRASATATDAAGHKSADSVVSFRVVRAK